MDNPSILLRHMDYFLHNLTQFGLCRIFLVALVQNTFIQQTSFYYSNTFYFRHFRYIRYINPIQVFCPNREISKIAVPDTPYFSVNLYKCLREVKVFFPDLLIACHRDQLQSNWPVGCLLLNYPIWFSFQETGPGKGF